MGGIETMTPQKHAAAVDVVEKLRFQALNGMMEYWPHDILALIAAKEAAESELDRQRNGRSISSAECTTWKHRALFEQTLTEELRAKHAAELAGSEKRAGEYRNMILKFLAMEHAGYLMVDDATRAAWIEEAKALADPQHGGGE
jgi:hypothetical protein